jgi:putative nucleotidyltransferase with HDIG domain
MAIPTRDQAQAILRELHAPRWLVQHSIAVAEVATFLAARYRERGIVLPADLPETAALLHDVDKTPRLKTLKQALGHGTAGASWIAGRGYPELSAAIACHPATRLADETEFNRWFQHATPAELIVVYADKRARQQLVSMTDRFATWQSSHPERADEIIRGRVLAERLERQVCEAAGITPAQVERLPWPETVAPT